MCKGREVSLLMVFRKLEARNNFSKFEFFSKKVLH